MVKQNVVKVKAKKNSIFPLVNDKEKKLKKVVVKESKYHPKNKYDGTYLFVPSQCNRTAWWNIVHSLEDAKVQQHTSFQNTTNPIQHPNRVYWAEQRIPLRAQKD